MHYESLNKGTVRGALYFVYGISSVIDIINSNIKLRDNKYW